MGHPVFTKVQDLFDFYSMGPKRLLLQIRKYFVVAKENCSIDMSNDEIMIFFSVQTTYVCVCASCKKNS